MPSRIVIKNNVTDSYYHVYTRGAGKKCIFLDESDYRFFFALFDRYLSKVEPPEQLKVLNQKLYNSVDLLAYCLMPNHFHLLLYQINEAGMMRLMQGIMKSYSRYFNTKYGRSGPLFESQYKASRISSDDHLLCISRYIHINPDEWIDYPYSSIRAYLYDDVPCWMNKNRITKIYKSTTKYFDFLKDYQETRDESIV